MSSKADPGISCREAAKRKLHALAVLLGLALLVGFLASAGERPARLSPLLASWESFGGCGSSSATGAGAGVKWIGRSVSGGLFNVECQGNYTPLLSDPKKLEYQFFLSTLISMDLEKWILGVNMPLVYKYMRDPYGLNVDLSNSGLGDVFLQVTRKLGTINDTLVTAAVGLPTGKWDQQYKNDYLRQHQQLGFGKPAFALTIDHTMDEIWGKIVVGGSGTWRGGENKIANYRAPSASTYAFVGYFLGPLVPAMGLSLTGFTGHDRDRSQPENSGLYLISPTFSLEWSTDWIAVLAGASFPYQYDGIHELDGARKSPWGWGAYTVTLGVAFAPF
jgi:hypothetical protein